MFLRRTQAIWALEGLTKKTQHSFLIYLELSPSLFDTLKISILFPLSYTFLPIFHKCKENHPSIPKLNSRLLMNKTEKALHDSETTTKTPDLILSGFQSPMTKTPEVTGPTLNKRQSTGSQGIFTLFPLACFRPELLLKFQIST